MSMIEDITKEMQALRLRDEHKKSLIMVMTKEMQALRDEHKKSMRGVITGKKYICKITILEFCFHNNEQFISVIKYI
jgi:hypothetical protein